MVMVIVPLGPRAIDEAAAALADGLAVVLPTDTVYGIAVDAFHPGATDRLFAAKGRPRHVDLPVLVGEPDDVHRLAADVPPLAAELVERWWPGPLTLVLRRRPHLDVDLGERHDTVGVRCPASDAVRELATRIGPLATTSANPHGRPTPPTALEVAASFGPDDVAVVVDGGECNGLPSTVVDVTGDEPRLLREGAIAWSELLSRA
jgi:L-threonylcarbamoyladenylate synthase